MEENNMKKQIQAAKWCAKHGATIVAVYEKYFTCILGNKYIDVIFDTI